MYHCNVRSIQNKKVTIENILMNANIDIGILSEINTKNVPHIKGYTQYTLYSPQRFHGLTICVNQQIKNSVMEIPHEKIEGIELIHLRYNDSLVPINIIGCYFDVECRSNNDSLQKSWLKFKSIIDCILATGEGLTLLGDCNRPLFSDKNTLGVKLMNDWLNEESCVLLNDKTYTRIDPASGAGSVLDLGIISRNILSTVRSFTVDSDKNWTPFSILKKGDDLEKKFTDHRAIILELKLQVIIKNSSDKRPFINTNNKSKWANFSNISDKHAEEMMEIINENEDVNIINIKLGILNFLMLIECFGISWKKESSKKKKIKKDYKELQELFELQFTELNEMIDEGSSSSSLMNKIYDVKKKINGPKVKTQGPRAINDPTTGDLITEVDEIKRVSLNHNIKILTKNKPRECDKEELKIKQANHDLIMKTEDKDAWELDKETFIKVTNKIKLKNKNMYKHFIKSGEQYKNAIFVYMKKLIKCESIPTDFANTTLVQIWKRKGSALDLNNMRFIHLRHWHCKLLEALITEIMKINIVSNTPNIQLGGMPGSSSVEHLVVLKTWMKQNEQLKKPGIFNTYDMAKFFDKESLLDCMYSLSKYAKIDNKCYRIWYKINNYTRICVNTSVGTSEYKSIDDSVGQGQVGAALVSSLSIGCAVEEAFRGITSASIG